MCSIPRRRAADYYKRIWLAILNAAYQKKTSQSFIIILKLLLLQESSSCELRRENYDWHNQSYGHQVSSVVQKLLQLQMNTPVAIIHAPSLYVNSIVLYTILASLEQLDSRHRLGARKFITEACDTLFSPPHQVMKNEQLRFSSKLQHRIVTLHQY